MSNSRDPFRDSFLKRIHEQVLTGTLITDFLPLSFSFLLPRLSLQLDIVPGLSLWTSGCLWRPRCHRKVSTGVNPVLPVCNIKKITRE